MSFWLEVLVGFIEGGPYANSEVGTCRLLLMPPTLETCMAVPTICQVGYWCLNSPLNLFVKVISSYGPPLLRILMLPFLTFAPSVVPHTPLACSNISHFLKLGLVFVFIVLHADLLLLALKLRPRNLYYIWSISLHISLELMISTKKVDPMLCSLQCAKAP